MKMATKSKQQDVSVELVVRRGAVRRFNTLKDKAANLPVAVTWDRRQEDRRRASAGGVASDRRTTDRRKEPPFTWEVGDFVVVQRPDPPE